MQLTIQLMERDYQRLQRAAKRRGKSVESLIQEWIAQLPENDESFDVTKDPLCEMEGYDSQAPEDLSLKLDDYLYRGEHPK